MNDPELGDESGIDFLDTNQNEIDDERKGDVEKGAHSDAEDETIGKKRKRKCNEEENVESKGDEEDAFERFEYEVEESVVDFVDEECIGRNSIPDSSDDDEDPIVVTCRRIKRGRDDKLAVGTEFFTAVEFKEVVLNYALRRGYNLVQDRWEKTKIGYKCGMGGNCKWKVYCSYNKTKQMFLVKKNYLWHSCTPNCKILKSPVIGRLFMDKLRLNPNFMPADIQQHIKERWKLVASIHQCQRGRLLALKWLEEEYAEQFTHLRGYIKEIHRSNPGSTTIIDTYPNAAGEDIFNRFYVCFNILRTHWAGCCRPIIGLDGTFLKLAVKGVLLAAVGHDPNNQIYPIAWAVVQSETAYNWLWFIKQLKVDLGLEDGSRFIIMSDRSKGLISAVKSEIPNAEHRMCVKHIVENLKKNHAKKDRLKEVVWKLAWSYTERQFDKNLSILRSYDLALYNDVMKEQPKTWSRAFYRLGPCCEDVDNNSTESFNSTITKARAKAMVPMLETIRRQAMERINKRKLKAWKHQRKYSKYVVKLLAKEEEDASRCTVCRCTHGMFEVDLDGSHHRVNMQKSTCTCGKWQISGIPCEHAYGVCLDTGTDVENHVSGYFLTEMWRDTYETANTPMVGPKDWMTSGYRLITAPPEPELPGRKKKKKKGFNRIIGKFESPKKKSGKGKPGKEKKAKEKKQKETLSRKGSTIHCSKCHEAGHNAAGCKKYPKAKKAKKAKRHGSQQDGSSAQGPKIISLTQPTQATQEAQME